VTKNSDEERLLQRAARHRLQLHSVDSLGVGLDYARRNNDSVVATDATVADYIAEMVNEAIGVGYGMRISHVVPINVIIIIIIIIGVMFFSLRYSSLRIYSLLELCVSRLVT